MYGIGKKRRQEHSTQVECRARTAGFGVGWWSGPEVACLVYSVGERRALVKVVSLAN